VIEKSFIAKLFKYPLESSTICHQILGLAYDDEYLVEKQPSPHLKLAICPTIWATLLLL
jgi:hypothetical protein